jgi:peptidoglycan hydrolase-like protein with peptidoglycan-binding domain
MLWMGATGDPVRAAQRLLGTSVTGTFGIETRSGVLDYQRSHDLPPTGAVDRATWAALLPDQARSLHPEWTAEEARTWLREVAGSPELDRGSSGLAVTALQATLGLRVVQRTGFYGPRTEALVSEQGR